MHEEWEKEAYRIIEEFRLKLTESLKKCNLGELNKEIKLLSVQLNNQLELLNEYEEGKRQLTDRDM